MVTRVRDNMVSEPTTPLSTSATIDPAMDPCDRAILLCKQILTMLSGSVLQPEDANVDQKLADGCNNSTSYPSDAMLAECSTLGLSPNIGGVEAADSSQQSEESDVDQELTGGCDNTPIAQMVR
jgi:hypothetical protein